MINYCFYYYDKIKILKNDWGEKMSEEIKESGIKREKTKRKPKKSQIPIAIIALILAIIIGAKTSVELSIFWLFGLVFGYVLQRSRFCFTAGFRDPWLTGGTSVSRAILVAVGLASIGFAAIKIMNGGAIDMKGVDPIGIPLMLGAILFGIGMVIAGGCASGTLMRVGEGFVMQILSLVFFIIGSGVGIFHYGEFWEVIDKDSPAIYLPETFGWVGAILIQLGIIICLYIAVVKWQEKKLGSKD